MQAPVALVSTQLGGARQVVARMLGTPLRRLWLQPAVPELVMKHRQSVALPGALAVPLVETSQAGGHLQAHSEARVESQ